MFHHPAWAEVATVAAHQPGELPKSKSTQPRSTRTWDALYVQMQSWTVPPGYVITDQPLRQMKINHVIEKTYIRSAQLRLPIHLQGGIFCNELHPLSFALTVCYAAILFQLY